VISTKDGEVVEIGEYALGCDLENIRWRATSSEAVIRYPVQVAIGPLCKGLNRIRPAVGSHVKAMQQREHPCGCHLEYRAFVACTALLRCAVVASISSLHQPR